MSNVFQGYANYIWQDGNGVSWTNLPAGQKTDNVSAKCRLSKGSKPKTIYIDLGKVFDDVEIVKADMVLSLFEKNWGYIHRPNRISFFDGRLNGRNAPYTTQPFLVKYGADRTGTVKREENTLGLGFGNGSAWYKNFYNIPNMDSDLARNLIVKLEWGSAPTSCYMALGWSLIEYVTEDGGFKVTMYSDDEGQTVTTRMPTACYEHKIYFRNDGSSRKVSYRLDLPPNTHIASKSGYGVDNHDGTYTKDIQGHSTQSASFTICGDAVNFYTFKDTLIYKGVEQGGYEWYMNTLEALPDYSKEGVTYSVHPLYAEDIDDYIDVRFVMDKDIICEPSFSLSGLEITRCELLNDDKENVQSISFDAEEQELNITRETTDAYRCWVRMYCNPSAIGYTVAEYLSDLEHYEDYIKSVTFTVHSNCSGKDYPVDLNILPPRGHRINFVADMMKFNQTERISTNIGIPEVWTIRCKASKRNFFKKIEPSMQVKVDDLISYIGCVKLGRPHKADVTSDFTNSLIANRFENRVYMGKKGDIDETISMTLRMPKENFLTLQGLVALDKPIGVDTVPFLPDGDVINHRGWCEIYGVKNVHKINDFLYEGDIDVKYLKHDINTAFLIEKGTEVTQQEPNYYLSQTHSYTDKVTDLFELSNYRLFNNLEADDGSYIGNYTLDENDTLLMNTTTSSYADWSFKWRNFVPDLVSEDHDKNWSMKVALRDLDNGRDLVSYTYSNFKHYSATLEKLLNECDVTLQVLQDNGTYTNKQFKKLSLLFNDNTPLLASNKIHTKLTLDTVGLITTHEQNLSLKLTDEVGNALVDKLVYVKLTSDINTYEYEVLTDYFGRITIPIEIPDGDYSLVGLFGEDEEYEKASLNSGISVNVAKEKVYFVMEEQFKVYEAGKTKTAKLVDLNGTGVSNRKVYYQYKGLNGAFGGEQYLFTDINGEVKIPIYQNNGNYTVRLHFKGDEDYNPTTFDTECFVKVVEGKGTQILSNDVEYVEGSTNRKYNIILQDSDSLPIRSQLVKFIIYDEKQTIYREAISDDNGSATINLNLPSSNWSIDAVYEGDAFVYLPCVVSNRITIKSNVKTHTKLVADNFLIDNYDDEDYEVTLKNARDMPLSNKAIRFIVDNEYDGVVYTDSNGKAKLPFRSNNHLVKVKTFFYGDSTYESCNLVDSLNFRPVTSSAETEITIENNKVYLKSNNVSLTGYDLVATITDTNEENFNYSIVEEYASDEDGVSLPDLDVGTYSINVTFRGNNALQWCSTQETVTITTEESLIDVDCTLINLSNLNDGEINIVSGYLEDENGEVVAGALLKITDDIGEITTYALSDEDGIFHFEYLGNSDATKLVITGETDYYHEDIDYEENISVSTVLGQLKSSISFNRAFGSTSVTNNQDIILKMTSDSADDETRVGDYFLIKLLNKRTREELNIEASCINNATESFVTFFLERGNWLGTIYGFGNGDYSDCVLTLDEMKVSNDVKKIIGAYDKYNLYYASEDSSIESFNDLPFSTLKSKCVGILSDLDFDENDELVATTFASQDLSVVGDLSGAVCDIEFNDDGELVIITKDVSENTDLFGLISDLYISNEGNLVYSKLTIDDFISNKQSDNIVLEVEDLEAGLTSETVTLVAQCLDKNSEPLQGIKVNFYNRAGTLIATATTNYEGIASKTVTLQTSSIMNTNLTPQFEDYDGNTYGSTLKFEIRDNKLNIIDYGYNESSSGKIVESNIPFLLSNSYGIVVEIDYINQSSERVNPLDGLIQVQAVEDIKNDEVNTFYSNLICSPARIPYATCVMTRVTEEGRLYYYNYDSDNRSYIGTPFNQYKGGCRLSNELGSDIFDLDNAFSPVYMDNGLIKVGFHRRSGYITTSVFDAEKDTFIMTTAFKIDGYPDLMLPYNYDDDKLTLQFGASYWTIWRGKPYVEVKHNNTDIRILTHYDRVYSDMGEYDQLKLLEEATVSQGVFSTDVSTQLFKQELHIGENLELTNFKAYNHLNEGYLYDGEFYKDTNFESETPSLYTGEVGELYYDKGTSVIYTWNGSAYEEEL